MQPRRGVESMTTQANIQTTDYLISDTHPNIRHLETPCMPSHSYACLSGLSQSGKITRAAIEDAGMSLGAQEAVVSITMLGGTTSLTVALTIPAAADDADTTSRDAMTTLGVLDGSVMATAVHKERKKNRMSAPDIVGNEDDVFFVIVEARPLME
ncbi:hypothetical protein CEP54_004696 [Fusarium duplospermum]|uniref:Uncharacterized protein n=1 Tax=Fusarium duplospermum TaxID=1325734 RepID=A0A428QGV5_9HYPO|nr:hypothetical protein CEP54_004696 [Fusarium duplospermum]